jgi:hypothetical protein
MRAKVSVTQRALIARINRALAKQDELLKTCREDGPSFHQLGRYYIVDINRNMLLHSDIDLEELGRELGVFRGYEALAKS